MAAGSPRYLVLRDLSKAIGPAQAEIEKGDSREAVPPPLPGYMKLYSFYKPSLVAGSYTVKVNQDVTIPFGLDAGTHALPASDSGNLLEQPFEVIAPQYTISSADIHSTYPPQGHADQPNVLPHMVFSDPHLPWERHAKSQQDAGKDDPAGILPWLAVFPFDCTGPKRELQLTDDQLGAIYTPPAVPGKQQDPIKQSSTFTISMTLGAYLNLPQTSKTIPVHIPLVADVQDDASTSVEVFFISKQLFMDLFTVKKTLTDVTGKITTTQALDLDQFTYCAHVRNVNTTGMPSAGVEDTGLFSILHSRRTGPTDIAQNNPPRSQVVHLISLEGVDKLEGFPEWPAADLIAFVSLYSWTYLCQPPLTVNFVDCKLPMFV